MIDRCTAVCSVFCFFYWPTTLHIYYYLRIPLSTCVPTRKMDDVCMHECAMSRIRRKACQMEGFQEPPNKFQFWWQGCTWLQTVVLCLVTQVKILFTAVRWSENLKYVCLEVGKKQMTSLLVVTCQELLKVWKTDHEIPLLELGGHGRKSSRSID